MNWIPIVMVAYISRCPKADKRLEGRTPDCINSILKTTSQIHNISICFSNLNLIVLFKEKYSRMPHF